MTVKVEISTRNFELSKRLEEYITKKASKLDRHLDAVEEVRVDLAYEKSARDSEDRQVAQITVRGRGLLLRAEERTDDIFASYDEALATVNDTRFGLTAGICTTSLSRATHFRRHARTGVDDAPRAPRRRRSAGPRG